jgi:hypothetical protein
LKIVSPRIALSVFDWALFYYGAGSASASFIGSTKAATEMRSIIFLARIEIPPDAGRAMSVPRAMPPTVC